MFNNLNEGMLQFISAILCLAMGGVSGYISNFNDLSWYNGLKQPPFRPPNQLFGLVWTALYAMIGVAFGSILANGGSFGLIFIFGLQFVFNLLWSPIFFKYHLLKYSFMWILALWVMILATIVGSVGITCNLLFFHFPVYYLFLPYLAWVSFASILNGATYALNGE